MDRVQAVISNDNPTVADRAFQRYLLPGLSPLIHAVAASGVAFATKYMHDLGDVDVADFQVFAWNIEKWGDLEKRITSPQFQCGGHNW
jgi:hypothetical protein